MTKLRENIISTPSTSSNPPIKVALIGLTMVQQSLMEFYFATQEGAQHYTAVLGKEAEAFITNFDESGAIEAWENLYSQEKKPTLVFSDHHKITDHYLYIPKPITPHLLIEAAGFIQDLLTNKKSLPTPALELTESIDIIEQSNRTLFEPAEIDTKAFDVFEELSINTITNDKTHDETAFLDKLIGDNTDTLLSFDALNSPKSTKEQRPDTLTEPSHNKTSHIELEAFDALIADEDTLNTELDHLNSLEELTLDNTMEAALSFEPLESKDKKERAEKNSEEDTLDTLDSLAIEAIELVDQHKEDIESIIKQPHSSFTEARNEPTAPANSHHLVQSDNNALSFESSQIEQSPDDGLTSPDELQSFIDELSEKDTQQEKRQQSNQSSLKKKAEQQRWIQLCGRYSNKHYENDSTGQTRFKPEETLAPYLSDTISFTERAKCWMELSYKPLSIVINPDEKLIYSNLSLENPIFVQICGKKIVEELIEFLEVNEEKSQTLKNNKSNHKVYCYDLNYFIWTVSLLTSRGRLPENSNPNMPISIVNWLNLNKVEKFPYIMQIAGVFNQHHASLNEVASWMTLPKRYVYAFYNGIVALDMIDKNPKTSTKQDLINMGSDKNKHNSMLKNILFKKII